MLAGLFRTKPEKKRGAELHAAIVRAARNPELYGDEGVPDTLAGRLELVLLHASLLIHVLQTGDETARKTAQAVFDCMFDDFDAAMRELGVGDSGVGKKIRFMAEGFYGRAQAYTDALASDDEALLLDLTARNVFDSEMVNARVERIAEHARKAFAALTDQGAAALIAGEAPRFG